MERELLKPEGLTHGNPREYLEYLLVAYTDESAYRKVMEVRMAFSDTYGQKEEGLNPFITIACFLAREVMEETLIRWMQRICGQQRSFPVTLNNYSGIPLHTLYLRVFDHQPFRQLANQLKVVDQYIRSNGCPDAKLTTRPYLAIARSLPESIYEKAIKDYSLKSFCETFRVNELVLLRRSDQHDNYKTTTVFPFLP